MERMSTRGGVGASADAAAAFARRLHDAWGVGSGACDNGALLLVALRDRQLYISTGDGAAAAGLRGKALQAVLDGMKPALRGGRPGEAVLGAIHNMGLVLAGEAPSGGGGGGDEEDDGGGLGIFAFFATIVASVWGWGWWSNKRRSRRFKVRLLRPGGFWCWFAGLSGHCGCAMQSRARQPIALVLFRRR
jgi:uncharacterized membrane protein YgcG